MENKDFKITLTSVREEEFQDFKKRIQEAFGIAVEKNLENRMSRYQMIRNWRKRSMHLTQ